MPSTLDEKLSLKGWSAQEIVQCKDNIERQLKPILEKVKQLDQSEMECLRKIERAQHFNTQLSNAHRRGNAHEQAMIHKKCEEELEESSPQKFISKGKGKIEGIVRKCEKQLDRAKNTINISILGISELVVDGSNLCYEDINNDRGGQKFIGLLALDAIIPQLRQKYSITIFFDPGTPYQLNLNEKAINEHFAKDDGKVTVHITKAKADISIMNYIKEKKNDSHIYILSNDHYDDFTDFQVIKDKRVINFKISNRIIEIPILEICAEFLGKEVK